LENSKRKILVTFDPLSKEQLAKLEAAASPDFELVISSNFDEIAEAAKDCEIFFGHATPEIIRSAKNLKWLHTQFAGVDGVLKPEVGLPESVILTNSAGTFGIAISEYLVAVTLMLMRNMRTYMMQQQQNEWKPGGAIRSIYRSNITIVGLGDIGSNFAERCRAIGATVSGVVRTSRKNVPSCVDSLYTIDQLDEAIKDADVVALCLPGTSETAHLFNKARMLKMKKNALLLNVGRGSAIDQEALVEVLKNGHLGGAGLDVTTPEPLPAESELWNMTNVIVTPHISGNYTLALTVDLILEKFLEYLADYKIGKPFKRVVDRELGY